MTLVTPMIPAEPGPSTAQATEPLMLGLEVTIATAAYGNAAVTRICLDAILRSAGGEFQLLRF